MCRRLMLPLILKAKKLLEKKNYKKELQKTNQNEFRIEKVKKRKGDKLNVKQKGYNNSFNSWIDEKGVV